MALPRRLGRWLTRLHRLKLLRRRVTTTVGANIFAWPVSLHRALLRVRPRRLLEQSLLNTNVTFSSQFSGMGTMEEALHIIGIHARACGLKFDSTTLHCCDINKGCQKILKGMSSCVFADMGGFCKLPNQLSKADTYAAKIRLALKAPPQRQCLCVVHGTRCHIVPTDIAAGGSPCTDHSLIGRRAGVHGPTFSCFLSWARWVSAADIGVAVHENVVPFPSQAMYDMQHDPPHC